MSTKIKYFSYFILNFNTFNIISRNFGTKTECVTQTLPNTFYEHCLLKWVFGIYYITIVYVTQVEGEISDIF